jgi:hypothetical protein
MTLRYTVSFSLLMFNQVDLLKNKFGFDEAFNYKEEPDLNAALGRSVYVNVIALSQLTDILHFFQVIFCHPMEIIVLPNFTSMKWPSKTIYHKIVVESILFGEGREWSDKHRISCGNIISSIDGNWPPTVTDTSLKALTYILKMLGARCLTPCFQT